MSSSQIAFVRKRYGKKNRYCSHGTHRPLFARPQVFPRMTAAFCTIARTNRSLDLQMRYSAVNFGYKNKTIIDAVKA
jgi:hypothetical protein